MRVHDVGVCLVVAALMGGAVLARGNRPGCCVVNDLRFRLIIHFREGTEQENCWRTASNKGVCGRPVADLK